jgi:hypothetical protein
VRQVALRTQLLDQLLERQVLVREGVECGLVRSTSVFTKKPISPSISARVRLAMPEPTERSSWRV